MSKPNAALGVKPVLFMGGLALTLLGCTQEPREAPPPDCTVEDAYEFLPLFVPAPGMSDLGNWYAAGDTNAMVAGSLSYNEIADFDGSICEHTLGKVFTAGHNYEWGSVAGRWQVIVGPEQDASGYEGFSFWGLSAYDRSIEMIWADATSAEASMMCEPETRLTEDPNDDPMAKENNPNYIDANGVPVANACGSAFSRRLVMSKSWKLYTLPFSDFYQNTLDPRFKPEGLDTSQILQLSFRVPKDTFVENSFVNFAWYRKKPVP